MKTVFKIIKYKTNYLYSIGDYTVINSILEAALRLTNYLPVTTTAKYKKL